MNPGTASSPDVKFFVLSLNRPDFRRDIYKTNLERIPKLKRFHSINGFDIQETIAQYNRSKLVYHGLAPSFHTYGMLANFLTKFAFLKFQVLRKIPLACWIEDDLELTADFVTFVEDLTPLLHGNSRFNMVRLRRRMNK